jgi:hypothetical protein
MTSFQFLKNATAQMIHEAENLKSLCVKQNKATETIIEKFDLEKGQDMPELPTQAEAVIQDLQTFRAEMYEYVVNRLMGFGSRAEKHDVGKLTLKETVQCPNGTVCSVFIGYQSICYHYYSCPTWPCSISK